MFFTLIPILALLSNYDQENCLSNVGTEGFAMLAARVIERCEGESCIVAMDWSSLDGCAINWIVFTDRRGLRLPVILRLP